MSQGVPRQASVSFAIFYEIFINLRGSLTVFLQVLFYIFGQEAKSRPGSLGADTGMSTTERLLVCVGPSPSSVRLIKAGQKMAAGLKAEWFAVYVEDPRMLRLPETERSRAVYNLRLAEQLGGEAVTLRGRSIAPEIIRSWRASPRTHVGSASSRGVRWMNWCGRAVRLTSGYFLVRPANHRS
jgi:K+-sensing histidine kinase KdpD